MERRMKRLLYGFAAFCGVALFFMTCSNPIDILQTITKEVKSANGKFLVVKGLQSPAGTTSVNPGTPITIEFDRPLNTGTVSSSTITILPTNGTSVKYSLIIDYSNANKTVTLTPKPYLEDNTLYDVTVTPGVLGDDASELETPISWSFKTGVYPAGDITFTDGTPTPDGLGYQKINYIGAVSPLQLWVNFKAIVGAYRMSTSPSSFNNFTDANLGWITIAPPFVSGTVYEAPAAIALPAGDGQKTIYIQYLAKNGMDMSLVATDKVILDTTPPTVSAGTMGTLTQSAPTRTTNAKAEDVSGITKWNWTGPAAITFGSPNALNTTISASADGTYVVTLTVTDGVLHTNSADLTVKRDATPPNVPVFNAITTPAVTPTWTWASGGGGIGTYLVQLWTPKEEVRWEERLRSASFPVNKDHLADLMKARIYPLSDGKWTLKVAEYDDVGNLSNFAEQDVVVVPALPLDGAMVNLALPIHFEWRPMTNGYRIFYATAATNPKFALLGTTEAINYIDIPAKTLGLGTYYWYVQGTTFLPAGAPKTYFTVIVK